jgi:hypothetical protein
MNNTGKWCRAGSILCNGDGNSTAGANGSVTKILSLEYHHLEILKKLTTAVILRNDEREISAGKIQK